MRTPFLLALALVACTETRPVQNQPDTGSPPPGTDASNPPPPKDAGVEAAPWTCDPPAEKGSFFELSSPDLGDTRTVSMCEFRGKVILVVNVASQCGYTPQYEPLQQVFEKYEPQGFVVLGFPCNQFGTQEPGNDHDISTFCTTQYHITFPMFTKSNVNAPTENPIYTWLKAQPGGAGAITWNFNKFLLGKDGKLVKRYDSPVEPDAPALIADIEAALAK